MTARDDLREAVARAMWMEFWVGHPQESWEHAEQQYMALSDAALTAARPVIEAQTTRSQIKAAFYAGFQAAQALSVNDAWEVSATRREIDAAAIRGEPT